MDNYFTEPLTIDRNTHAPIETYEQVLNYVSQTYGTPISPRINKESMVIKNLHRVYGNAIEEITKVISEGKHQVSPSQNKYNIVEFQTDYMEVPIKLVKKGNKISRDKDNQRKIDINSPNFLNSLYSMWSDIDSRKRVLNVCNSTEIVEGKLDSESNPLHVVRPKYEMKYDTTMRLSTKEPNIQGMSNLYKNEFLLSEENRVLVGADVSSQEANIFFNGLCRDEYILEMYEKHGDIYRPLVAKIENISLDNVDKELRSAYKTGAMVKMNNGGLKLIAQKMGSMDLAVKFNNFVNNNPNYAKFIEKVERQLLTPEPQMESFIKGRKRIIKQRSYKAKNQLVNTPLQLTAVAFISISMFAFINKMMEIVGDWSNLEEFLADVRPIYHAHDEIVLSVINEKNYPEIAEKCLSWALGLKYENWTKFRSETYIGNKYTH